jgi:peptidoglycan/LPS O-acetylase OafA/YrhL
VVQRCDDVIDYPPRRRGPRRLVFVVIAAALALLVAAADHRRRRVQRRLFTAIYVVCYVAFSVPALIGGMATDSYGLGRTTTGYTIFVLLMVAIAAARLRSRPRIRLRPPFARKCGPRARQ